MANYKAEFFSHYYEKRLSPRHAYSFGLIYRWARFASWMPAFVNFFTQIPLLGTALKRLAGIALERRVPVFAPQMFKQSFRRLAQRNAGKPK